MLVAIKALHSLVWLVCATSIIAIPFVGIAGRFDAVAVLTSVIVVEVGVLAWNGGRCPLTAIAARYTDDRRASFDIYLPDVVARHNKGIFGTLFVVGAGIALIAWITR